MRVDELEAFITPEQQEALTQWVKTKGSSCLTNALTVVTPSDPLYRTSRRFPCELPKVAYEIRDSIELPASAKWETMGGNLGVAIGVLHEGGEILTHVDHPVPEGYCTVRVNTVFKSPQDGGSVVLYDKGNKTVLPPKERTAFVYNVTDYFHRVTKVTSDRYILMLSFIIPTEDFESLEIQRLAPNKDIKD